MGRFQKFIGIKLPKGKPEHNLKAKHEMRIIGKTVKKLTDCYSKA